jgi:hypothetical protein
LRLVRSTALLRAGRWEEASAEVDRANAAAETLQYPWWEGALLRQIAVLAATRGAMVGVTQGWEASLDAWRDAVEQGVAQGSVGDVALTMRAAAVVAKRLGEDGTAQALLDAAPHTQELTVLPDLFPDDARKLDATRAARREHPDLAEALRRARMLLAPALRDDDAAAVEGEAVAEAVAAGAPTSAPVANVLRREGDTWTVVYAGRVAHVRHLKGFGDLAMLLARPGAEVHCLELMGGQDVGGGAGPALDQRAKREYETRIRDLQSDIDDARAANDLARAERAEDELDALVTSLAQAFGLGGRARQAGSAAERARTAVAYRLRAVLKRLDEVHPELGRHLANAVRSGTWCSYRPETDVAWDVDPG